MHRIEETEVAKASKRSRGWRSRKKGVIYVAATTNAGDVIDQGAKTLFFRRTHFSRPGQGWNSQRRRNSNVTASHDTKRVRSELVG